MHRPRTQVYVPQAESNCWALETDRSLLLESLAGWSQPVERIQEADLVHTVWWRSLLRYPAEQLLGKRILCQFSGEPRRTIQQPEFRHVVGRVGRWIAQTHQAGQQLNDFGLPFSYIPYTVDERLFFPTHASREAACEKWGVPQDAYLIGSFQRDSEGADLTRPKLVKGPDVLLAISRELHDRGFPIHLVLAGPRRQWLRAELARAKIPFTQIGESVAEDDFPRNSLPAENLNELYNLLDLYLVTSRSEGGPRGILEAAAAGCPVLSTPVGLARDVLDPSCVFEAADEAVSCIERDRDSSNLRACSEQHYQRIWNEHRVESVAPRLQQLYEDRYAVKRHFHVPQVPTTGRPPRWQRWWHRVAGTPTTRPLTVGLWHHYVKPPYGGGNQFMMALRKGLQRRGVEVMENCIDPRIHAYVLNSVQFDVARFSQLASQQRVAILHRIDGPIHLIRGRDREQDELCYGLNQRFATATVLQSSWTYRRIVGFGYEPVSPAIIHNGVDADIFYPPVRPRDLSHRKIRLIATSWSDNPNKGGDLYRWLEEHLDPARFEFTFVGRTSTPLQRATHREAVPSEELGDILRQHDIYITASRNDPCSNALIEAQACGLPALYRNDGGHPELVGHGGLPFHDETDVLTQLDRIANHYQMFAGLVKPPTLEDAVTGYLSVLQDISQAVARAA